MSEWHILYLIISNSFLLSSILAVVSNTMEESVNGYEIIIWNILKIKNESKKEKEQKECEIKGKGYDEKG